MCRKLLPVVVVPSPFFISVPPFKADHIICRATLEQRAADGDTKNDKKRQRTALLRAPLLLSCVAVDVWLWITALCAAFALWLRIPDTGKGIPSK